MQVAGVDRRDVLRACLPHLGGGIGLLMFLLYECYFFSFTFLNKLFASIVIHMFRKYDLKENSIIG